VLQNGDMPFDLSKLYQVDDYGHLFISPVIKDWSILASHGIDTVVDLEGGLDECIPTEANSCLYVYFPIFDEELPDLHKLEAVASLGAHMVASGHNVLSHCGMGFNRSALVAGRILHRLGMPGEMVLQQLRERRPGALFNEVFAEHIRTLPPPPKVPAT
jgi:protein-tyrosine phosphatase